MMCDAKLNQLVVSVELEAAYPSIYRSIALLASRAEIELVKLSLREIRCADSMPVQLSANEIVLFQNNSSEACIFRRDMFSDRSATVRISPLVLSAENMVRNKHKVILGEQIFKDNPDFSKDTLLKQLIQDLRCEELVFLPVLNRPGCRAAGDLVRFVSSGIVLIKELEGWKNYYRQEIKRRLQAAGLQSLPVKCIENEQPGKKVPVPGTGSYLNFIRCGSLLIVPAFDHPYDVSAYRLFRNVFSNCNVQMIRCAELEKNGLRLTDVVSTRLLI